MKIDLVQSLRDNSLYRAALEQMPEKDRERAKSQVEGMLAELSSVVQAFVDRVEASDDETRRDFKVTVDEAGEVVIHEISQTSGSHG